MKMRTGKGKIDSQLKIRTNPLHPFHPCAILFYK